jgi:lysophospholipase L1-like esterase
MSGTARGLRVVLAGDSTVAPYVATAYPMSGWGAHLGAALTARTAPEALPIHVVDLAKNGATTESHREEGLWAAVLDAVRAGDLVLLQFGHNDQKREHLDPWGGYTAALTRMIDEVREVGAQPVLCTPVARRHYADGELLHTHGDYPAAVIALSARLDVPLLDLNLRTRDLIESLGEEPSRRLFTQLPAGASTLYPDGVEDDTHFHVDGAITVAEIVAELLAPLVLDALHRGRTALPR